LKINKYISLKRYSVFFLFFSLSFLSYSQLVSHWSESEGLSNRRVNHAVQDKDGFIWLATVNGLNRFNGYNFLVYDKSNLKELCSNEINYLLVDSKQRLWIGTSAGLNLMDMSTHKILNTFKQTNYKNGLKHDNIQCIVESANHEIVVSTFDGYIYKYISDSTFFPFFNPLVPDGSFGKRLTLVYGSSKLFARSDNFGCFIIDFKKLKNDDKFGNDLTIHHGYINRINDTSMVINAEEGAFLYNTSRKNVSPLINQPLKDVFFTHLDYKGDYWFAAGERKHLLRYSQGVLSDISNQLFDFTENVHISFILEDNSHNLWICTGSGIYKLSNERLLFNSVLRKDQIKSTNYISSFRGMMQDSVGTIFIGGYGGLFRMDKDGSIKQLFDNKIAYTPYILFDKNKTELWALCEGFGILSVNKTTGQVNNLTQSIPRPKDGGGQYFVSGIIGDDGKFWIGSYEGLLRYDPKSNKLYSQQLKFGQHFINDYVFKQIYRTSNGNIWLCCSNGVFVLDKNYRPIAHYDKDAAGKYHIPVSAIRCVYEANDKTIWLGTEGGGLILLNDTGYTVINTTNRLADNAVASILQDNHGSMWVATNNGLSQINSKNKITNFYTEQGLSSNEFNGASFLKTKSGLLLFGGVNGINICNPEIELKNQNINSQLVLSRAEIPLSENKTTMYYNDANLKQGISLSHNLGYLYFEFFVNDYLRSNKNTYEYILEGYNDHWISLGENNSLRFAGINSGKYVLKIRAANSRGTTITNQISIPIKIEQVFYKTWWFITLLILFFSAIVVSFLFVQFRRFKEQSEMRIKIASDLHDDVGSVLTKIAMQADILEEDVTAENKPMVQSMSASCRAAMTNMRDMVWSIDSRNKNIGSLFDKMSDHTHLMFESGHFEYSINFDKELKDLRLSPIQKQETFYIFKEAINNLVKHSNGNKVLITASKKQNHLKLFIHDNGTMEKIKATAGSGLQNMQLRAARLNGKITFIPENGYSVTLLVPLKKSFNIFDVK
jgi:ligand-binding sensor domain-containing protein/two-component sensor histidine kinase